MLTVTMKEQERPARSSAQSVVLRNVVKSYDGMTAVVKGIDLNVQAGEFLTILGPSGSGKTSLLMMLAGFEQPTSGEILLGGNDVSRLPPYKRNIGMVFQQYALFPHLTVAQNLAFPLEMRGWARDEIAGRVAWAMNLVRLKGLEERRPAQLSGGQQQRIAVARALIFDPELVLMDEPLGALDKQLREQMQEEFARIHRELKPTIIYVTHDQGEAISLSDRVAVFDGGRISQIAPPKDLYEKPESAFVATFIGETNRIPVRRASASLDTFQMADGRLVSAVAVGMGSSDDRGYLMVRPERLRRIAGREYLPNVLEAIVLEATYHGDNVRVRAGTITGDTELLYRISNDGNQPVPHVGEQVLLGWRTEDARAFPAS
ncbi:ABC transporter ATP-binding protein [Shinella sumterensis]|uniref:Putative spermidine/putrescine transport system ATP-binding protein n=1 Tax=Rhizobium subbaraonis TaxID=908946 RepID=A0A285US51_9HYPH|nr:ABC transporter ATP-binding protein [Rhizobium subbaraonis]WLS08689.1 ABC transporter ATP-binding protein [Shinella sumterensis]SOC44603.1 putative spermidine/putrescine transport system ATP-binding protein [Rhizobium subbaraonis]